MPKNNDRIRTPSFRAKMSSMKGLGAEEKALFQRIGNLVDVITLTQRQELNPGRGRNSRIRSNRIPVPSNLILSGIAGGVQASWDPVNIGSLSFYDVQYSETSTFSTYATLEVVNSKATIKGTFPSGTIFVRVRTVTKTDATSDWSSISNASVGTAVAFDGDGDFIDPENRTTILPKPTLISKEFNTTSAFIGIGAHIGPGPITMLDQHNGFTTREFERNEIAYDLFETGSPYPSREQRTTQNFGEYLDRDGFYIYNNEFYMRFTTITNSVTDFFDIQTDLEFNPTSFNVEYLRYRIINSFYNPRFPQTGIVLNSSMGIITF